MSTRFLPRIIPPKADHFPPTLRLTFAGMPVAAVCFAELMKKEYSLAGAALNATDCSITGVTAILRRIFLVRQPTGDLQLVQQMAHFRAFGFQVGVRDARSTRPAGNALDHANSAFLKLLHLIGIVGEQSHPPHAEQPQ